MNEQIIPLKAKIQVILRDKNGNVKDVRCFEKDLLVKGFFRMFYNFFCKKTWAVQDEDSGWRDVRRDTTLDMQGWFYKVAIGESDASPSVTDYSLKLKVSETTGLGITDLGEVGNKAEFDVTAKLTVPIERDIGEIGLFGWHTYWIGWTWESRPYLFARDIFSPKIHMTTTDVLDIRYRFTVGIA